MLNHRWHHFRSKPRGRSQSEWHADALKLNALPHEPHVPAVDLADKEVRVEVAEIHVGNIVVAVKELLDCVQALHLEVLVPDALVGSAEMDASPHLAGALLWNREEGQPEAVGGLRW